MKRVETALLTNRASWEMKLREVLIRKQI